MVFAKEQADVFRNWVLGFGFGNLQMQTMGGRGIMAKVSNILFLNVRMAQIQRLIATAGGAAGNRRADPAPRSFVPLRSLRSFAFLSSVHRFLPQTAL